MAYFRLTKFAAIVCEMCCRRLALSLSEIRQFQFVMSHDQAMSAEQVLSIVKLVCTLVVHFDITKAVMSTQG